MNDTAHARQLTTDDNAGLTLDKLAEVSGVSARTIRFYVLSGVVSGPDGQGPAARYPRSHVTRLRLVRRWQDDGLQLAAIAQRLGPLSDSQAEAALNGAPSAPKAKSAPLPDVDAGDSEPALSPSFPRTPWERFEVEPGVELHVRRPLTTAANRRVQELLRFAAKTRGT